jgi:hypothetical protein
MDENTKIVVTCPCCSAQLTLDIKTGAVLWHQPAPKENLSLADMVKELETRKRQTAERMEREKLALKDRQRVTEEKVKEAMKHVDKDGKPLTRPIDLD